MRSEINQIYLQSILLYNPETGAFFWRKKRLGILKTRRAGSFYSNGYRRICIDYTVYLEHRLAFLYMTGEFPENHVDHIDGNRANNKWVNLREATPVINGKNQKMAVNNVSGITGVRWKENDLRWVAYIQSNKKQIFLGCFENLFDAACARKSAQLKYQFHENHGRRT